MVNYEDLTPEQRNIVDQGGTVEGISGQTGQNTPNIQPNNAILPTSSNIGQPTASLPPQNTQISTVESQNQQNLNKMEGIGPQKLENAGKVVDPNLGKLVDEPKFVSTPEASKENKAFAQEDMKIRAQFGYGVTPEEREKRNNVLAQSIFNSNQAFDAKKISDIIKQYVPGVNENDINNTVSDIKAKYDTLVNNKQLKNTYDGLIGKTGYELAKINIGTIGEEALKTFDPNKYAEYKKAKEDISFIKNLNEANGIKTTTETSDPMKEFTELVKNNTTTPDYMKAFNDYMNTPEIQNARKSLLDKQAQLDTVDNDIRTLEDSMYEKYKGASVPDGFIRAKIAKAQKDLLNKRQVIADSVEIARSNYNGLRDSAKDQFGIFQMQDQANRQAFQDKINLFNTQYGIYRDSINDRNLMLKDVRDFQQQKELLGIQSKIQSERDYNNFLMDLDKMEVQNKYNEKQSIREYKQDLEKIGITNAFTIDRDKLNFQQQKELAAIQNKYQTNRDVQNYLQDMNKLKYSYENDPSNIEKMLDLQLTYGNTNGTGNGILPLLGNGKITGYGGAYDNYRGLDVDGTKGQPVFGIEGVVESGGTDKTAGNYIRVRLTDGSLIQFSHLDKVNKFAGDKISPTDIIGLLGNTGRVIPGKGGDGSHLDITMRDSKGNRMNAQQVEKYLRGYNPRQTSSLTATQQATIEGLKGDYTSLEAKKRLMRAGVTEDMVENYLQQKAQGAKGLTDDQRTFFFQAKSQFQTNKQVIAFEDALSASSNLLTSLNDISGAGDMAGIYQFMKSLDPTSVVRTEEYNNAARTTGLVGQAQVLLEKAANGEKMTEQQRKDFARLAKAYISNKAKTYNRLYNDLSMLFENESIPKSYLPKNATNQLQDILGKIPGVTTQEEYLSKFYNMDNNSQSGDVSNTTLDYLNKWEMNQ